MATTLKQVREKIITADSHSVKAGVFTIRRGFFYTNGYTAEKFAQRVKEAFPTAVILESGEIWKPFRGGASVASQSHWFVKFSVPEKVAIGPRRSGRR